MWSSGLYPATRGSDTNMTDFQYGTPDRYRASVVHFTEEPCEHCWCKECKHKRVCCWCSGEREFDEGPDKDEVDCGII